MYYLTKEQLPAIRKVDDALPKDEESLVLDVNDDDDE
jgi:hypothetical protein